MLTTFFCFVVVFGTGFVLGAMLKGPFVVVNWNVNHPAPPTEPAGRWKTSSRSKTPPAGPLDETQPLPPGGGV
jgi:hypothetical protein